MRRVWLAASSAAKQIGFRVAIASACMGALVFGGAPEADATGLRVGVRIEQELHSPLVPVTRNFRVCFQQDETGVPVLRLCPQAGPAHAPAVRVPAQVPVPPIPNETKKH